MTQRIRLDQHLLEQAVAAGADVRDGVKVTDVEAGETGVSLRVDGRRVEGGRARRRGRGQRKGSPRAGARRRLRARRRARGQRAARGGGREPVSEPRRPRARHDPRGLRLGIPEGRPRERRRGRLGARGPDALRGHLAELCRQHGIAATAVQAIRGHRLPLRRAGAVAARGRALLVGDAAGLVDPLSGDGMYEAFVSARLASERRARSPGRAIGVARRLHA